MGYNLWTVWVTTYGRYGLQPLEGILVGNKLQPMEDFGYNLGKVLVTTFGRYTRRLKVTTYGRFWLQPMEGIGYILWKI